MASQYLTTSRLNNIISMIMLGRQSGILRVIRGQGPTREIGQIQFIDGRAVTDLLGQVTGANALTVLQNWGECVYSFDEQPLAETPDPDLGAYQSGAQPYDNGQMSPLPDSSTSPALSSGSWPAYGYMNSQPNPSPLPPSSSFANSYPRATSQPGYAPAYPGGYGGDPDYDAQFGTASQAGMPGMQGQQTGYQYAQPAQGTAPLNPNLLMMCPRRTSLSEHVEQLPLDRRERMVLLLVDGRRNLSDLARLTRRSEREILRVLEHLSGLGLIQFGA